jgi:hypothetical protein
MPPVSGPLSNSILPGDEPYISGNLPSSEKAALPEIKTISVPGSTKGSSVALDSTNSAEILAKMQAFLDERNSPYNKFMRNISDARAAAIPNVRGESSRASNELATRRNEEAKTAQEMQMQIAQFKAAQAEQQDFNKLRQKLFTGNPEVTPSTVAPTAAPGAVPTAAPGAAPTVAPGAAPTVAPGAAAPQVVPVTSATGKTFNFYNLPPEIQASALAQRDRSSFQKTIDTWAEKHAEKAQELENTLTTQAQKFGFDKQLEPVKFANSAAANEQKTYFLNGKEVMMTPLEYSKRANVPLEAAVDQGNPIAAVETGAAFKSGAPTLAALQYGVMGNESGFGKADTSKPGIQGAMGPMQVTADTFKTFQDRGVIPKNFDIKNPTQNQIAGNAILSYYYDKYKGDPDKVLAAYHGGEGAINKDGTINLDRKDALGTSIGDYIKSGKQKAGLSEPAPTSATDPNDYGAYKQEQKRQEAFNKTYSEGEAKDSLARRNMTIASYKTADDNIANTDYLNNLVNTNPKAFGVLAHPTVLAAIGDMIKSGTNTSLTGEIRSPAFESAVLKASPGIGPGEMAAVQKAAQKFAELQLNAAKVLLAGQGAVSDNERLLIAQRTGSPANSPDAIRAILKWGKLGADYDKAMGSAFNNWEKTHRHQDYRDFELNSPEHDKIKKEYKIKIDNLAESAGKYQAPKANTNPADIKPPPGYDPNWRNRKVAPGSPS